MSQQPPARSSVCEDGPAGCRGQVEWQSDGSQRCAFHARILRRRRVLRALASVVVAVLVTIGIGAGINALFVRSGEAPSQSRAWELCRDAVGRVAPESAVFPSRPKPEAISDSVKIQVPMNVYVVRLLVDVPNSESSAIQRDYRCTISYLQHGGWQITRVDVAP